MRPSLPRFASRTGAVLAVVACALAMTASSGAGATILQVSANGDMTCAVVLGSAQCWGYNSNGQLGNGTTTNTNVPTPVTGLSSGVTQITAGGSHACAIVSGGAWCWGKNTDGQLGNGTTTQSSVPVPVTGLSSGVTSISAGDSHTCAVVSSIVKCWGANITSGQLGNGTSTPSSVPVTVSNIASATMVSAGRFHTCAVASAPATPTIYSAMCWGRGDSGELGDTHASAVSRTPVVAMFADMVSAGGYFTCGTYVGDLFCWGFNGQGQLGIGSTTSTPAPAQVQGLTSGVQQVTTGSAYHACALQNNGLKCWGYNNTGQLGNPAAGGGTTTPMPVPALASGVFSVTAGGLHTCAVAITGLYCWGSNASGQLGIGSNTDAGQPQFVFVFPTIAASLSTSAGAIDFGGQSMNTTAPAQSITISNTGSASASITGITTSTYFTTSSTCGSSLAAGASCTLTISFTPTVVGAVTGSVVMQTSAGAVTIDLKGVGEHSLVTHYYQAILRRSPDSSGQTYWNTEAQHLQSLGVDVNETWYAMAMSFFSSVEYIGLNRDDNGYVTDLYNTFFNRPPDAAGLAYWTGQLAQGMPREVLLASFMFSNEFVSFTQGIFGTSSVRAEITTVVDFYRGILGRVPDDGGFAAWLATFRSAQCQGAGAVYSQVDSISGSFLNSAEYLGRNRTNAQFVGDVYNAFLRRGGDLAGVQFWISQLATNAATREQVRQQFLASPEFSARVSAIIQQGCLP